MRAPEGKIGCLPGLADIDPGQKGSENTFATWCSVRRRTSLRGKAPSRPVLPARSSASADLCRSQSELLHLRPSKTGRASRPFGWIELTSGIDLSFELRQLRTPRRFCRRSAISLVSPADICRH